MNYAPNKKETHKEFPLSAIYQKKNKIKELQSDHRLQVTGECDLSTTFIRYHLYEKIVEMVDGFMIGQVPLKSWGGLSDQDGPERPLGAP